MYHGHFLFYFTENKNKFSYIGLENAMLLE